ncbi:interaptin [Ochlerotatus camptorhynchus]|uniref:interaptin n=1 Tax=Ochlerotatus camptorhynchus TaxID=644619 RepID=UPI0031E380AA
MSINITVHSSQPPSSSSNNPFASLESVRKAENDKLRKTRLEQVRQQSKQLAANVRRKVEAAKQKELANVDKLKQAELKSWKQKHITKLQADYQHCLEDVGEAHKAAEAAEQCEIWFQEKKATQQATAIQRGRHAEAKLVQDRESRKPKKRKEYKPTKSIAVQVSVPAEKPMEEQKKDVPIQIDDSSSSVNTISAFEQFKKCSKANSVPDLRMQDRPLSPDFLSSDEEVPTGIGKNKENFPYHNTKSSKRVDTLYYNPTSFTSPDTLQQHLPAAPQLKPFTQVSEFIKRRREDRSHKYAHPTGSAPKDIPTYSSQKNVQFDDLSENTLSFPTSTAMDRSILESPRKPVRKLVDQPRALPIKAQSKGSHSKQSTTISSSVGSLTEPGTSKVQYYDYNTKYRKEYDQPTSFVQRIDKPKDGELNAMQEATRLVRLQNEMLNARRQAPAGPDRSKVALEKLQIRKDYENLQLELDKLVRAESQVKALDVTTKPLMTETRQRQQSEARQKRMNQAVEDLLKQRVLITCPVVRDPPKGVQLVNRPSQVNVAAEAGNAVHLLGDDSNLRAVSNSSDSCSTILLGYEQGNGRAGIPLPETDKVGKLKELLEQINEQKKLLTEELKKEEDIEEELKVPLVKLKSTKTQTDNGIKKMQQRQQDLEQQQKNLHEKEREIRDLEKQLKEKLNRLEKEKSKPKVPIHVEAKGSANTDIQTVLDTSSTGSNDSIQSGSEIPVKIVITVNDKSQRKVKKTPKKAVPEARKRKKAKDVHDHRSVEPPKAIPKSPSKAKEITEKTIQAPEVLAEPEASPISSTTSTIYRQLPNKIDNRVGKFLNQLIQSEVPRSTKPPPPPPPRRAESAPKHQLKKTTPPPPPVSHHQQGQNLNPNLMQYIVRLLGMSRHSIEQLGVSSSTTVSTPCDSVVNVSGNQSSVDEQTSRDQSRMDKLRRFINENYNFLNEIDETLKEQELSGTADENISRVEDVWMKTLSRKEREIRQGKAKSPPPPPVEQSPPVKESSLKSILKSPKQTPAKVAKIITPQGHVEVINLSDRDEQEVLEKYSHLAESCSKRISELSDMIQKVRQEKKKLIENSLSSSDQPESSTKYMDFPRTQQKAPAVETSPQSAKDDPVSEEINNIFTNARQIGLSKDSGIAMSRPVTSSDYRDSPDTRPPNAGAPQFESSEDLSSRETVPLAFEPLLKDIPKISPRLASIDVLSQPTASNSQTRDSKEPPLAKRTKPPVAITRYSPQLEEGTAAHELSTILEVETPLALKANISIPPSEMLDPAEQLLVDARDKLLEHARALGYEGFPNYQQYVREQNLEVTRYDPEKTCTSRLNELLEVSDKSDLRYQKFPVPAPEMNVTEETLKGSVNGKKPELESNSSSSTSLPDVVAELKLRNIIDKSFDNSLDDSNRSTPNSGSLEFLHPQQKTNKSPTKKKQTDFPKTPDRSVSETTASLERDLNQLGLRWASTMLKKNQQALLQDHSSSSSLSQAEDIRRGTGRKPKPLPSLPNEPNDSLAASGRPLNLKEFIARELMIRTHSDLNSLSDSSSPCSLLLRSLLDISNINASTPELLTQTTTDRNIQRTSTPVATKSSSGTPRENEGGGTKDGSLNATNGLFSGESRISSVHMSSSSGGENRLTVPNVRLDLDKYTKGKGDNGHDGRN